MASKLQRLVRELKGVPTTYRQALEAFEADGTDKEWQQLMMYSTVIRETADVPGDIAEFGVASGTSLKAFARMNNILNKARFHKQAKKHVWGFDSFEGLPELDREKDLAHTGGREEASMKKGGFASQGTLGALEAFCKEHEHVSLVKGWFDDTVPEFIRSNPHMSFSLLHVDCDLYQSTKVVLEHVLKRLNVGGVILFDEIFHKKFPGETEAFWEVYNSMNDVVRLTFTRAETMPWKWYCRREA